MLFKIVFCRTVKAFIQLGELPGKHVAIPGTSKPCAKHTQLLNRLIPAHQHAVSQVHLDRATLRH